MDLHKLAREAKTRLDAHSLHSDTVQSLDAFRYGGHGWVVPRDDGSKATCGGPDVCRECALERAVFQTRDRVVIMEVVKIEAGDRLLLIAAPNAPPSMVQHTMDFMKRKFPDIDVTAVQGFTGIQVSRHEPSHDFSG